MTNELMIAETSNAATWKASTDAASMCKEIVVRRAVELGEGGRKKKYVPVEGWQAIAIAHGCVASSEGAELVEGGVRAFGVIRRMSDGHEIARAEGFVGEDEPVWYGGGSNKWGKPYQKRPMFAIRAMAQTRAISRACRSAFAHVIVMMDVGLETTPAEEMQGVLADQSDDNAPAPAQAQSAPAAEPEKKGEALLSSPTPKPRRGGLLNPIRKPEPAPVQEIGDDEIPDFMRNAPGRIG